MLWLDYVGHQVLRLYLAPFPVGRDRVVGDGCLVRPGSVPSRPLWGGGLAAPFAAPVTTLGIATNVLLSVLHVATAGAAGH